MFLHIVIFELDVDAGTEAQIDFFVKKKQNEIGSLTHHWKEENKIFPKGYFLPRETDCNMEKLPHFKPYQNEVLSWLVSTFDSFVGLFLHIVVFELDVGTGTKAQIDFFVKKKKMK